MCECSSEQNVLFEIIVITVRKVSYKYTSLVVFHFAFLMHKTKKLMEMSVPCTFSAKEK